MTLDTRFIIHDPVIPPRQVFDFCRDLLGADESIRYDKTGEQWGNPGWHNLAGQGLPALLYVHYGADGPLVKDECYCEDEYEEGEADPDWKCSSCRKPVGFVEASFDTTYGYQGENGEGCSTLHAILVAKLGQWCDERNLGWSWHNEFTGEWHEDTEGLLDFCADGVRASDWFQNTVLPIIQREIV